MGAKEQEFLTALYERNFKKLYFYVQNACAKRGISKEHTAELSQEIVQDTLHTAAEKYPAAYGPPQARRLADSGLPP